MASSIKNKFLEKDSVLMSIYKEGSLTSKKKIFALVDCNNFYVSCERVFNPQLRHRPVIVMSNNDGCVISRSQEVKDLGIKMGEPMFKCAYMIKRHQIEVFSSNFALYGDISDRVMSTLSEFSRDMEIYSVDEAFLSLDEFLNLDGKESYPGELEETVTEYARLIRATVLEWTGIPVSIGIGPTKTLAKAANHLAKKDPTHKGVFSLLNEDKNHRADNLKKIPVGNIWGIGRGHSKLMKRHYIKTAYDLSRRPRSWVQEHMKIPGLRTVFELNGVSCIGMDDGIEEGKKSIICSRSFSEPVANKAELAQAVALYISRASERMRRQGSAAQYLSVYIRTNPHKNSEEEYYADSFAMKLPEPSFYTPELIKYAHYCLDEIFKDGYRYKKASVTLSGLVPARDKQINLFTTRASGAKQETLMQTIDTINSKWGTSTLAYAATGLNTINRPWKFRQKEKSKEFTTKWADLPMVRAT